MKKFLLLFLFPFSIIAQTAGVGGVAGSDVKVNPNTGVVIAPPIIAGYGFGGGGNSNFFSAGTNIVVTKQTGATGTTNTISTDVTVVTNGATNVTLSGTVNGQTEINMALFGVIPTQVIVSNASIANGSTTLTWTDPIYVTSSNIGNSILITGAGIGGIDLSNLIMGINNSQSVALKTAAGNGIANTTAKFGVDVTSNIQAALNIITNPAYGLTATGAKFVFPYGSYVIAGPRNPSHGNAQFWIPDMPSNSVGQMGPTITLLGAEAPYSAYQYDNTYVGQSGTLLSSYDVNVTTNAGRVFDTHNWDNPTRYGGQHQDIPMNNVNVSVHDLGFSLPRNVNNGACDLGGVQGCGGGIYNIFFDAGYYEYQVTNLVTFTNMIALTLPPESSGTPSLIYNIGVCGYYAGIRNGDNEHIELYTPWDCVTAFTSYDGQGHASTAEQVQVTDCLWFDILPAGSYGNPIEANGVTFESGAAATPDTSYYPMIDLISDTGGLGGGSLFFERINGYGTEPTPFSNNVPLSHLANPALWNIASYPSIGAASTNQWPQGTGLIWLTASTMQGGSIEYMPTNASFAPVIKSFTNNTDAAMNINFDENVLGNFTDFSFYWAGVLDGEMFFLYNGWYFQVHGINNLYLDNSGDATIASNVSWGGVASGNGSGLTALPAYSPIWFYPPITNGLVAWWKLTEGSRTNAFDYSGSGYTALVTNASQWGYFSANCVSASNYTIALPTLPNASPFAAAPLSYTAWVNPASLPYYPAILGGSVNSCPIFRIDNAGTISFQSQADGNILSTVGTIPTGVWTHVAVTYGSGTVIIYTNGIQAATGSSSATFGGPFNQIGNASNVGEPFNGSIKFVDIFNRVLSAAEVSQIYQSKIQ